MQGGKAPRVGIIGTGWGVTVQVPSFREAGWQVVAICGRTEEKTKKIGADLSIPFTTADPQKLIEHPDVDFVTVSNICCSFSLILAPDCASATYTQRIVPAGFTCR